MADVRPYQPEDLDNLLTAWEAATREAHPFMSDDFIASERKAIPELYIPNTITHVAEVDCKVVGFISLFGSEVGAIFVHPSHHGAGHGLALMEIGAAGHDTLEVEVFENNKIAHPFYARWGFSEISRSVHEATGELLIRMRWVSAAQPQSDKPINAR